MLPLGNRLFPLPLKVAKLSDSRSGNQEVGYLHGSAVAESRKSRRKTLKRLNQRPGLLKVEEAHAAPRALAAQSQVARNSQGGLSGSPGFSHGFPYRRAAEDAGRRTQPIVDLHSLNAQLIEKAEFMYVSCFPWGSFSFRWGSSPFPLASHFLPPTAAFLPSSSCCARSTGPKTSNRGRVSSLRTGRPWAAQERALSQHIYCSAAGK